MDKLIDKQVLRTVFKQLVAGWNLNSKDVQELINYTFQNEKLPFNVLYDGNVLSDRVLIGRGAIAVDVDGIRIPFAQDFACASYDRACVLARSVSVRGRYCHLMNENEAKIVSAQWDDIMFCWRRVVGYSPCIERFWLRKPENCQHFKAWSIDTKIIRTASDDDYYRVVAVLNN